MAPSGEPGVGWGLTLGPSPSAACTRQHSFQQTCSRTKHKKGRKRNLARRSRDPPSGPPELLVTSLHRGGGATGRRMGEGWLSDAPRLLCWEQLCTRHSGRREAWGRAAGPSRAGAANTAAPVAGDSYDSVASGEWGRLPSSFQVSGVTQRPSQLPKHSPENPDRPQRRPFQCRDTRGQARRNWEGRGSKHRDSFRDGNYLR